MMQTKYHMINWVDGMKIRKQHFVDQQHAYTQQMIEAAAIGVNAVNYGLLLPSGKPSGKISVIMEPTGSLHVDVFQCDAITSGGALIRVGDENGQPVHFSVALPEKYQKEAKKQQFMLVLAVDPFKPTPAGEADPEETPVRHPYVKPDYRLSLLSLQDLARDREAGAFHLSIAEIQIEADKVTLSETYIPPCRAVYSFPALIDLHSHFYKQLSRLESLCVQIMQKILVRDQKYLLAQIVYTISQNLLAYLNTLMYRFNWQLRYEPPLHMVESIAGLGRIIKNSIDIRQGTGKEELINYFVEWCDLNQAQFEEVVSEVVDLVYVHTNIRNATDHCSNFLNEIVGLYSKLSELDYIGRKTEKDIFVKEEEFKEGHQGKSKISFWSR